MKDAGSGESTSKEAFEPLLPWRVLEFEAGFEIPSKFPFIISIDLLKQANKISSKLWLVCLNVSSVLIGSELRAFVIRIMSLPKSQYPNFIKRCLCPWIITSYVTIGAKNMLPGCQILKVAKKECRREHHLNGLLCLQEKQLLWPWPKKTLTEHHTPRPRFMLHCNNLPRPLLSSGFTFLILAQPSARAPSQLWFFLSSLVLHFHGVLISRWPHSSINPPLLKPMILLLPRNNREPNLLSLLEDWLSLSGYTLPISLTIFHVTPSTRLSPVWLLYS